MGGLCWTRTRSGLLPTNRTILIVALALWVMIAGTPVMAQSSLYDLPEKLVDSNGVDLAGGKYIISFPVLRFGEGNRLKLDYFGRYPQFGVPWHASSLDIYSKFSMSSGTEEIETGYSPFGPYAFYRLAPWEVVMPDGRAYSRPAGGVFRTQVQSASWTTPGHRPIGMVDEQGNYWEYPAWVGNVLTEKVRFADGETWTIKREAFPYPTIGGSRLRNAVSSRGYMIQYEYELEGTPTQAQRDAWQRIVKISAGSLAHNHCDTSGVAVCAAISTAGNSVTLSHFANGYEITHASGFKKRFEALSNFQMQVSTPGTNELVKVSFGIFTPCDPMGSVTQVIKNGKAWNYAWEQCTEEERGVSWMLTRTDPEGHTIKTRQLSFNSLPDVFTDELNREYGIGGSPQSGYSGFSFPEGSGTGIGRNARNMPTSRYVVGKNHGILQQTASYDPVCSNFITCNRPKTTSDGKGNTTTYTYDPVHGGVLTKTGPAVDGIAPQTRYEYAQRYAWLKTASGGYAPAAAPIWVLTAERFCRTTAGSASGCAGGAADEVVTTYDYGPDSGPQNLLVRGVAVTADGQTRRTCYSYDTMGRQISETRSGAGLASCP